MAKIIPIAEQFQHFLGEMKESFWGDLYGQTNGHGSGFSNCSRNGSATGLPVQDAMNGGGARQAQYEKAVEVTKRGLRLQPDWLPSNGNLANYPLALQHLEEAGTGVSPVLGG
jgi:hypothetical protein